MEEKRKAYVVCSKTLKELQEMLATSDRYVSETITEYIVDRSDMSEAQKMIQTQNGWHKELSQELRVRDDQIYNLAKKLAIEKILNGCKKNIKKEVHDKIYNESIRIIASFADRGKYLTLNTDVEFGNKDEWGNDNTGKYEYSNDLDEFQKKLKDVKYHSSFAKDDEYVLLERFYITARTYHFSEIDKLVDKQINKFVKEELTYCLKNDEIIIPQEYLDKGEEGIKEWREIKASKNKNNSIEKKILRQAVADKKKYAYDSMVRIMFAISSINVNWAIPYLEVDGRYNKQRTAKLVNKILEYKGNQFYIETSEEEIMARLKDYWVSVLAQACGKIEALPVEEDKNGR